MITSYGIIYLCDKCFRTSEKKRKQIKVIRARRMSRNMPLKEMEESVTVDKEEEEKKEEGITYCS